MNELILFIYVDVVSVNDATNVHSNKALQVTDPRLVRTEGKASCNRAKLDTFDSLSCVCRFFPTRISRCNCGVRIFHGFSSVSPPMDSRLKIQTESEQKFILSVVRGALL